MKLLKFKWVYLFLISTILYACKKNVSTSNTVKDKHGNVYHTVTIGGQVWTKNLW